MVNKIVRDIRQYTCKSCGYTWIARRERNPVKCPNPKCQQKLNEVKPEIRITRTETTKRILLA